MERERKRLPSRYTRDKRELNGNVISRWLCEKKREEEREEEREREDSDARSSMQKFYEGLGGQEGGNNVVEKAKAIQAKLGQRLQVLLDKSTPKPLERWLALGAVLLAYFIRVFLLQGFYIVTYGLGIYNLNLLIGFISPQIDPETEGPQLPTQSGQEFKPFVRRLPEFKFWRAAMKSLLIGFTMTFFPMFDLPVFWPVLLLYWIMLFTVTMKKQIKHMIKYKYLPFSLGKKKYSSKESSRPKG